MNFTKGDQEKFIRMAMEQAELSVQKSCPPFGAVLVDEAGNVLTAAHNTASPLTDMTNHAEITLIRQVAKEKGRTKLTGCSVFINAASCSMCASALIQAGVRDFYYGAPFEPHTNPAVSYEQLSRYCHEPINIHALILADECKAQIEQGRQRQADQGIRYSK